MKIIASLIIAAILFISVQSAMAVEQKTIFCSTRYKHAEHQADDFCRDSCEIYKKNCDLSNEKEWAVVSSSPTEKVVSEWYEMPAPIRGTPKYLGCSCLGTEYVLRKESENLKNKTKGKKTKSDE